MPTKVFDESSLLFLPSSLLHRPMPRLHSNIVHNRFYSHNSYVTSTSGNNASTGASSEETSYSSDASMTHGNSISPVRSPDTTSFEEVVRSCTRNDIYLSIVEQPHVKYRFRYQTEMQGTHGPIFGINNQKNRKKTFPKVKLNNFNNTTGKAPIIRCTLYTVDEIKASRGPHVHRLVNKVVDREGKLTGETKDDPVDVPVESPDHTAVFAHMTILFTKKEDQVKRLIEKKINHEQSRFTRADRFNASLLENRDLTLEAQEQLANMNLNVVCLRFEALIENSEGMYVPLCEPIFSKPISNMKNAQFNELRICRVDKVMGSCTGKDEIYIFVEKVDKKNIRIRFFEEDENKVVVWSDLAEFKPEDVHHQFGIVFRTPPYRDVNITENKHVKFQLERKTDSEVSEARDYVYTPDPKKRNYHRKRPRLDDNIPAMVQRLEHTNITPTVQPIPLEFPPNVLTPPLTSDFEPSLFGDYTTSSYATDILNMKLDPLESLVVAENLIGNSQHNESISDSIPSANSDALSALLSSGRLMEWAELNDEVPNVELLLSQLQSSSNLEFDGPSAFIKKASFDWARGFVPDSVIKKETVPENSSYDWRNFLEPLSSLEKEKNYETASHQGFSSTCDGDPPATLTHQMAESGYDPSQRFSKAKLAPKTVSIVPVQPQSGSSLFNSNHPDKDDKVQIQMEMGDTSPTQRLKKTLSGYGLNVGEPQMCPTRFLKKRNVVLNVENIVTITETTASDFCRLFSQKKISEDKVRSCLCYLFSHRVGPDNDIVLHIMANMTDPSLKQASKFAFILSTFKVAKYVINKKNDKDETPLHIAVARGTPEMVKLLIHIGADFNSTGPNNNTPMHLAILREDFSKSIVEVLLERNPKLDIYNEDGYTAVHLIVLMRRIEVLPGLLIKSEDQILVSEVFKLGDLKQGNTVLHMAVNNRHNDVIHMLLNFVDQIDINARNFCGKSALEFVWLERDSEAKEIKEMLLRMNADCSFLEQKLKKEDSVEELDTDTEGYQVDDDQNIYADEWEFDLFDKVTISRLCPILDQEENWIELSKKLKFTDKEIENCKTNWSPSLFMFNLAARYKPEVTVDVVRDHLLSMGQHCIRAANYIDDMILRRLGVGS